MGIVARSTTLAPHWHHLSPYLRSLQEREMDIDLSPYMNTAALTVHHSTHAEKVQTMFRALGLRHLTVVNSTNQVVGMLTRADVTAHAVEGH